MDPTWVLWRLLVAVWLLAALSIASQVAIYFLPDFPLRDTIAPLFDVNREQNFPTLFSTVLLLVSALLSGAIAHARRRGSRPDVRQWIALCMVLVVLAVDELGSLHERAIPVMRELLDVEGRPGWPGWVILGVPVVLVVGGLFVPFLQRLPRDTRRRLWMAGLLFVGGALGFEILGGLYIGAATQPTFGFELLAIAEETLEMIGIAVLVYALLAYIPQGLPGTGWRLRVAPASRSSSRAARGSP